MVDAISQKAIDARATKLAQDECYDTINVAMNMGMGFAGGGAALGVAKGQAAKSAALTELNGYRTQLKIIEEKALAADKQRVVIEQQIAKLSKDGTDTGSQVNDLKARVGQLNEEIKQLTAQSNRVVEQSGDAMRAGEEKITKAMQDGLADGSAAGALGGMAVTGIQVLNCETPDQASINRFKSKAEGELLQELSAQRQPAVNAQVAAQNAAQLAAANRALYAAGCPDAQTTNTILTGRSGYGVSDADLLRKRVSSEVDPQTCVDTFKETTKGLRFGR